MNLNWIGGLGLDAAAFATDNLQLSALSGILGVILLWDGLEFWRQQNRVKKGHTPANPANPRHARILAEHPAATTFDWLDHNPLGRKLSNEEINSIKEANA